MLKLQSIFLLRRWNREWERPRFRDARQQAGFPENFGAARTENTLLRSSVVTVRAVVTGDLALDAQLHDTVSVSKR